jgi:hypothetical protein
MTAAQWFYGGFWLALGAALGYFTLYASFGMGAYTYGFIKGLFQGLFK